MPIEKIEGLPEGWQLRRSFPDEKGNCRWILEKVSPIMTIESKAEYEFLPTVEFLLQVITNCRG